MCRHRKNNLKHNPSYSKIQQKYKELEETLLDIEEINAYRNLQDDEMCYWYFGLENEIGKLDDPTSEDAYYEMDLQSLNSKVEDLEETITELKSKQFEEKIIYEEPIIKKNKYLKKKYDKEKLLYLINIVKFYPYTYRITNGEHPYYQEKEGYTYYSRVWLGNKKYKQYAAKRSRISNEKINGSFYKKQYDYKCQIY